MGYGGGSGRGNGGRGNKGVGRGRESRRGGRGGVGKRVVMAGWEGSPSGQYTVELLSIQALANRSLVKYLLIIEEFGGWPLFQQLLRALRVIADRHGPVGTPEGGLVDTSIAMVAIGYVLRQRQVRSVIIGAQSDK